MLLADIDLCAVDRQGTFAALGISGSAAISAEKDDPVTEVTAFLRWQDGSELLFHFLRLLAVGKTQTAANANAVGVTDHTARDSIQITQQQVGSLSSYAGEF